MLISERTKKALEVSGKKGGRPPISDEIREEIKNMYFDKSMSVKDIKQVVSISQSTIYRILKERQIV